MYLDDQVGETSTSCYQFELKVSDYTLEFSVGAPKFNCNTLQDLVRPKTLRTVLDSKHLTAPFPVILRNGRSDGYAIMEQLNFTIQS